MSGAIAAATMLLAAAPLAATAEPDDPACPTPVAGVLEAADAEGINVLDCGFEDLRIDVDGSVSVVPEPGVTVTMEAAAGPGTDQPVGYSIAVDADGIVAVTEGDLAPTVETSSQEGSGDTPAASYDRCGQGGTWVNGWKWQPTRGFTLNVRDWGLPSGVSLTAWNDIVDKAQWTIDRGITSCSFSNGFVLDIALVLGSDRTEQVGPDMGCGERDGYSSIGFGPIDGGIVGATCTWRSSTRLLEADIRMDNSNRRWSASSASCSQAMDLRTVATHELGHAVGLSHQGEYGHGDLTMSPTMRNCEVIQRQLGYGDLVSLRHHY
ncbi:matrixin family metalloprotease [Agrococcus baldri]|uniref:matrixin family metalloprotease n=1 Tax=Agrococcus baldri TaxID=153730 RepID=UPI001649EF0A|nr:matrixin family metalloprotease [Agrococcus baldri]